MNKKGYTLIEMALSIVIITISVAAILVVMSKVTTYTGSRGSAADLNNVVTVSQYALDQVRDQRFPPTGSYGSLQDADNSNTTTGLILSNTLYTYQTEIRGWSGTAITTGEYDGATYTDDMSGDRNLLKVTVGVCKGSYNANKVLLQTITYKTRNGYY